MTLTRIHRNLNGLQSAYEARATLRTCLGGYPTKVVDVAVLLASELVSNALRHAHGELQMDVRVGRDVVHVAVADETSNLPVVCAWSPLAESGRGMFLVDALSSSWGVEVDPDKHGKRVWFDVSLQVASDDD